MIREPFEFERVDFQVFGRSSVKEISPEVPHVLISITDPSAPEAELAMASTRLAVLRLQFWDTENPDSNLNGGITAVQAEEIVRFIATHVDNVRRIVCQCEAGISRSAGAAAALSKWLNGDDSPFFSYFASNFLVYQRVLEAAKMLEERIETL